MGVEFNRGQSENLEGTPCPAPLCPMELTSLSLWRRREQVKQEPLQDVGSFKELMRGRGACNPFPVKRVLSVCSFRSFFIATPPTRSPPIVAPFFFVFSGIGELHACITEQPCTALQLCACLPVSLPIYPSSLIYFCVCMLLFTAYFFIYLIYLIYLCVSKSVCVSVYPSTHLSIYLPTYLSISSTAQATAEYLNPSGQSPAFLNFSSNLFSQVQPETSR